MARQLLNDDAVFPVHEKDLDLTIPADDDAVYYLRPITVAVAREIRKRHTRQVHNKRTHQREDELDNVGLTNEMLDYALVRWEGVKDRGLDVACELANKLKLPGQVSGALIELAQAGQATPESRAESFREPPPVLRVLGG